MIYEELVRACSRSGTEYMTMHTTTIWDCQTRARSIDVQCLEDLSNTHIPVEGELVARQQNLVRNPPMELLVCTTARLLDLLEKRNEHHENH